MRSDLTASEGWAPSRSWLGDEDPDEGKHLGWLYLILLTGCAALLRLYLLTSQSLWVDEIMTWRSCRPGAGLQFWPQIRDTFQGPLYLAVLWPLVRIEASEFWLRLPAAVAGTITVPLFALAARRWFDMRTARLAALLLAISPFHVWYSQEARGYAFVMLFTVAASLVLVHMVQQGPRLRTALAYALLGAAAVGSNMSALFLVAAHGLTVLLVARPHTRQQWLLWILALGGLLVLVLPWVLKATGIWAIDRLVPGSDTGTALRGSTTFAPLAVPFTFYSFFFGFSLGPSLRELHLVDRMAILTHYWPLLVLATVLVGTALLSGLVRLRGKQTALLVWIVVPLAIVVALALRNVKPYNPRYLAVVFPWVLLLATAGLLALPRLPSRLLTVALVILCLGSLQGHYHDDRYAKADVRRATVLVTERELAGDAVVVPVVTGVFKFYYGGINSISDSYAVGTIRSAEEARNFLQGAVGTASRSWIVLARSWFVDPDGWLPRILAAEGEIQAEEVMPGVRLLLWRPPWTGVTRYAP